jgi:hypothetical protein
MLASRLIAITMKFQRTTMVLFISALILSGAVYVYENYSSPQRQTAQTEAKQLFAFKEEQIKEIILKTPQRTLSLQRNQSQANNKTPATSPPKDQKPAWTVAVQESSSKALPKSASMASVTYLLNLLATAERQPLTPDSPAGSATTLTIPSRQAVEFGFNQPLATIEAHLINGETHRLILGKPNFNSTALYAQVDPATSSGADLSVILVPIDFRNAVNRPLEEWQQSKALPKPVTP